MTIDLLIFFLNGKNYSNYLVSLPICIYNEKSSQNKGISFLLILKIECLENLCSGHFFSCT